MHYIPITSSRTLHVICLLIYNIAVARYFSIKIVCGTTFKLVQSNNHVAYNVMEIREVQDFMSTYKIDGK